MFVHIQPALCRRECREIYEYVTIWKKWGEARIEIWGREMQILNVLLISLFFIYGGCSWVHLYTRCPLLHVTSSSSDRRKLLINQYTVHISIPWFPVSVKIFNPETTTKTSPARSHRKHGSIGVIIPNHDSHLMIYVYKKKNI